MKRTDIQFIDLKAQQQRLGGRIEAAIGRVLAHGAYIMGPEVAELERRLAAFVGCKHVISCSSGTDALVMALMVHGVGPGDAVLVPSFTFAATAEAVALLGASPIFLDVLADTFNLDPAGIGPALAEVRRLGLKPRGIIVVDLFGQPADYDSIAAQAAEAGLFIIGDAAQSFGATLAGRKVGTLATMTATSFFPAKPLGCYGDGGAVFTDDDAMAAILASVRVHGKGTHKYDNVRIGLNARLDTLQAAILLEKFDVFPEEVEARQRVSERYRLGLLGTAAIAPVTMPGAASVWAQYTIRVADRESVMRALSEVGIPTAIYYPLPLHHQTAYAGYPVVGATLPVSDRIKDQVLALPMHPYLEPDDQDFIIEHLRAVLTGTPNIE